LDLLSGEGLKLACVHLLKTKDGALFVTGCQLAVPDLV
jgi:hypothetical protein